MPRKIEISHRTIIFAALFGVLLWFLFVVREIILQLFVALLITIILNPIVTKLSKKRIPRGVSAVFIYLALIGSLIFAISSLVPAIVEQTSSFAAHLPGYLAAIQLPLEINQSLSNEVANQVSHLPQLLAGFIVSIFSNTLTIITTLIISLYLVIDWAKLEKEFENFFGDRRAEKLKDILRNLEIRLGGWARGEIILMAMVGVFTYIGLTIIGIPYALPLSILAGFLELIPMLGPILAAAPSVIVGFSVSPITGVLVAVMAFLIQQLENYVFVPNIMKKSVGISPVVTLLSLIVGFKLAGIAGAILSIPVVISLETILASRSE